MNQELWPMLEARRLLPKVQQGKTIVFETGYGPSGLPHIGTFGEIARTIMIIRALKIMEPKSRTKLLVFSDDMDGLRKVPENIENQEEIRKHLGKPLTSIPDPFGTHESYGAHMNSKLQKFLELFEFEYDFKSATECYKSGKFNEKLLLLLQKYDEVMDVILPSIGPERRATYSPFLPICKESGRVLQVKISDVDKKSGVVSYVNEDTGKIVETNVTDGHCKLQWKPDWGMRWAAMHVDYEMFGKDIQPSAVLSKKICELLCGDPPEFYTYELFLDADGRKISKSKGNGLTIDEWLRYAPPETLQFFMLQNPKRAKRLYFDIIPRNVDEYIKCATQYKIVDHSNPISFIHDEAPNVSMCGISFGLLLNLASACNPESIGMLWGFIERYSKDITIERNKFLYKLSKYAVNYYNDFIKPNKQYRVANENEKIALSNLVKILENSKDIKDSDQLQQLVYDVGNANGYRNDIRSWFKMLYQVLLGQDQGPRIGSFFSLYGTKNTITLINKAL